MKLSKVWKIKFGLTTEAITLDAEQKVIRNLGFVFIKSASVQEIMKIYDFKLPIDSVECVGLIVEK